MRFLIEYQYNLIGYLLGTGFSEYIEKFDHWIAFALLAFIGGKMVIEAIREKDGGPEEKPRESAKVVTPISKTDGSIFTFRNAKVMPGSKTPRKV